MIPALKNIEIEGDPRVLIIFAVSITLFIVVMVIRRHRIKKKKKMNLPETVHITLRSTMSHPKRTGTVYTVSVQADDGRVIWLHVSEELYNNATAMMKYDASSLMKPLMLSGMLTYQDVSIISFQPDSAFEHITWFG